MRRTWRWFGHGNDNVRPDHGRHLRVEEKACRPGYGMYDRALGIMYLLGLWEALEKGSAACLH